MSSSEPAGPGTVAAALAELERGLRAGPRTGPGERLCVVVVDMQRYFVDGDPLADAAVTATAGLLAVARRTGTPVYLARVVLGALADANPAWTARFDLTPLLRGAATAELDPRLGPEPGDVVVEKPHASAFAGTELAGLLAATGRDTVLLCGLTTSGCIRATAVDGAALGLRVELVRECVADPRPLSGPVALADLQDRYADVIDLSQALAQLEAAREDVTPRA